MPRINKILLSIFTLCLALPLAIFSQNKSESYLTTNRLLTVEDGLASREVYCGVQDKDGFIWLGTRNGLNRYDGKNFLLFTKQHDNLRANKIVQLTVDDGNRLFIQYGSNLSSRLINRQVDVMDLKTHEVKKISEAIPDMPFKEENIEWISNDGTNELTFLTIYPYRIWRYSAKGGFHLRFEGNDESRSVAKAYTEFAVQQCLFQQGNVLWKISPSVFYYITRDTSFRFEINPSTGAFPFAATSENEVLLLSKSNAEQNLVRVKPNGQLESSAKASAFHLDSVVNKNWREIIGTVGERSGIFSAPSHGIYLWRNNELLRLFRNDELEGFLVMYTSFKDVQGNYWLCTSQGIFQVTIRRNRFEQYFTKSQSIIIGNYSARGIYADNKGNIYANVAGYVCAINKNGEMKSAVTEAPLFAIIKHKENLLTSSYSLFVYDINKNRHNELPIDKSGINYSESGEYWSLFPLAENKILIGSTGSIIINDYDSNKAYYDKYASENIPKAKFTYRFFRDNKRNLWAVASTGLYILNNDGVVTDYYGNAGGNHHLPFSDIHDVYNEGDTTFWLATNGEGLFRWNRIENTFKQFTIADGFPSNTLYRIESDSYNNLWISSDNGLVRFNTKTYSTNRYTVKDGISDYEFNRISSFKSEDGRLFFGGLNGVNAFYPGDFLNDSVALNAPLRITSYSEFSGKQNKIINRTNELLASNRITLEHNDKFFIIEFQLLDYVPAEFHRFAYKIDGIDNDWNYITENFIRISGLDDGKYVLHIKGQNLQSGWSSKEISIQAVVLKPFYSEWWFIASVILLILVLIYVFYQWRTVTLRKEKEFLEQTVNTRTVELRETVSEKEILLKEIHHRVKNNLQVISALLEMQGTRAEEVKTKAALTEAQNRVLSIAFIHQNLYQHDDIKSVEIHTFVNELSQHIKNVFSSPGCEVQVVNNISEAFLDIDTAVPLGLIINELLTNSYKYAFANTETGVVKVNLNKKQEGEYEFTYQDNGVGLPHDFDIQKTNTLGMRLVRQLCRQLAGRLDYNFSNGSRFTFNLKDLQARNKMN